MKKNNLLKRKKQKETTQSIPRCGAQQTH